MLLRNTEISARTGQRRALLVATILGLADLLLFELGWQDGLLWYELACAHTAAVTAGAVAILLLCGDLAVAVTIFLATLTTGPFGALAVAVRLLRPRQAADHEAQGSDWLRRIRMSGEVDREEMLYRDIVAARAYLPGAAPLAIGATMRKAAPADKIQTLSRIVTAFGRVPEPVLTASIKDDNLSVRAAAVAIRSRQLAGGDRPEGRR